MPASRIKALMTNGSFWRMREEASSAILLLGFALLLFVAAVSTYLSWDTSYRSSQARQANEIRVASLELLNAVQLEEIAAKDFLLTGDESSLSTHARAEENLKQKLARLTAHTAPFKHYLGVAEEIGNQIASRADRFNAAVTARREEGIDFAFSGNFHDASEASLAHVTQLLRRIADNETANLMQSRNASEDGRWWGAMGSTTSFLLSALLCAGALILLRRRVSLLKASEQVLSAFNAQLEMSVHRRTTELEGAKAEAQRERDRAEALLADLSHRVGNSLQIVSSLLGMHGARIKNPEAREVLESVRAGVHAIASAQRRVRLSGTNDLVEVNHFLDSLLQDLRSALSGSGQATITLKADEAVAPSHDAVSIGVIVTEAINNAIKYAARGEDPLAIEVRLEADQNKRPLRVVVEDDGTGFDEEASQAGFGSQISEALSTSLRAQLSRVHVHAAGPRRGTRIQLDFAKDAMAA